MDTDKVEKDDNVAEYSGPCDVLTGRTKPNDSDSNFVQLFSMEFSSVISHEASSDEIQLSFVEAYSSDAIQARHEDILVSFDQNNQDGHNVVALTVSETRSLYEPNPDSDKTSRSCDTDQPHSKEAGSQYYSEHSQHVNFDLISVANYSGTLENIDNSKPSSVEQCLDDIKQHVVVLSSAHPVVHSSNETWTSSSADMLQGSNQGQAMSFVNVPEPDNMMHQKSLSLDSDPEPFTTLSQTSSHTESHFQISKSQVEASHKQDKDSQEDEFDCVFPSFVPTSMHSSSLHVHQLSGNDVDTRFGQDHAGKTTAQNTLMSTENEWDKVKCIEPGPFDNEDSVHLRVLQTVFKKLTGDIVDCPRYGLHWEQIGFQGENPATDLRSVGFLSLLQLLYFITEPKSQVLAHDVYKLSLDETQSFPFALMGINLTKIALSALREDCLNKESNKRGSVVDVYNEFYHGMFHELYTTWRYQHKTIRDSGFVLADLETYAKQNTSKVIKTARTVTTLNRTLRNADFSNVVELTDEQTLRRSLEGLYNN